MTKKKVAKKKVAKGFVIQLSDVKASKSREVVAENGQVDTVKKIIAHAMTDKAVKQMIIYARNEAGAIEMVLHAKTPELFEQEYEKYKHRLKVTTLDIRKEYEYLTGPNPPEEVAAETEETK